MGARRMRGHPVIPAPSSGASRNLLPQGEKGAPCTHPRSPNHHPPPKILARLVALHLVVDCLRTLRPGFAEGRIAYTSTDRLAWLIESSTGSPTAPKPRSAPGCRWPSRRSRCLRACSCWCSMRRHSRRHHERSAAIHSTPASTQPAQVLQNADIHRMTKNRSLPPYCCRVHLEIGRYRMIAQRARVVSNHSVMIDMRAE